MGTGNMGRRLRTRASWGLVAIGLVGSAVPFSAVHAAPVATGACSDNEEAQFLDMLNAYRAENGLQELALSQSLSNASEYHSTDMATKGYFDHTMPDGTTVEQNVRLHGYRGETFGENIVAGTETAEEALEAWKNSPSHNENMLRGAFNTVGIGRYYVEGSPYGWYWTTDFGGTIDRAGTICGQASADVLPAAVVATDDASGDRQGGRRLGVTNDPDVNLRSGPGRDFPVLQVVQEGTVFEIAGDPKDGYVPIRYQDQDAWVAQEWVDVSQPEQAVGDDRVIETAQTVAPVSKAVTVTETINLRGEPSHDGAVLTMVLADDEIDLTGASEAGFLGATYQGVTGWVDSQYVLIPAEGSTQAVPAAAAEGGDQALTEDSATALENLNLRTGPSRAASVVQVVPAGTLLTLNGQRDAGYFGVTVDGEQLWADAAYLR